MIGYIPNTLIVEFEYPSAKIQNTIILSNLAGSLLNMFTFVSAETTL